MVGFLFGLGTQLLRELTDDGSDREYYNLMSEVFLESNSGVSGRYSQYLAETVTPSLIILSQ